MTYPLDQSKLENFPWKELYTKRWTRGRIVADPLDGMMLFVHYEGDDADEYDFEEFNDLTNEEK